MRVELDTTEKIVKLVEPVLFEDLMKFVSRTFGDITDVKITPNMTFTTNMSPIYTYGYDPYNKNNGSIGTGECGTECTCK